MQRSAPPVGVNSRYTCENSLGITRKRWHRLDDGHSLFWHIAMSGILVQQ
jgi:hypothetical protein